MSHWPHVPGVTVDHEETTDADDAFWLTRDGSNWALTVSITAVARRILPNSRADQIAQTRVFTRYRLSGHQPMLTHTLEQALSLAPDTRRKVLAMTLWYSDAGELVRASDPFLAVLDHRGRFSYERVAEIIGHGQGEQAEMFQQAAALANLLLERRRASGALAFYDLKFGWEAGEEGILKRIPFKEANIAHVIIQEFMVTVSGAMARFAVVNNIPLLYRNHTANAATPDRAMIMHELLLAASMPASLMQSLLSRMNMLLARASYGPQLLGHFGLNLDAYTHWTSPLRRYADLVNQRQILAFLAGEELPYDLADLESLAEIINAVEKAIKDAAVSRYQEFLEHEVANDLRRNHFASLDADRLFSVLELAANHGPLPPLLIETLAARLVEGRLTARELFVVLLVAPESPELEALKVMALEVLAAHPAAAPSILSIAGAKLGLSVVSYSDQKSGPDHAPQFAVAASATPRGSDVAVVTPVRAAPSRKLAVQQAAAALVGLLAGLHTAQLPAPAQSPPATASAVVAAQLGQSEDNVSRLNLLHQARGWGEPTFQVEAVGPPHARLFTATVTMVVDGEVHEATGQEPATSAKAAKQVAAKALLDRMGDLAEIQPPVAEPPIPTVVAGNYIGALQELSMARRWPMPNYAWTKRGAIHTCTCTVRAGETVVEGTANSPAKAEAKRQAARKVFAQLSEQVA